MVREKLAGLDWEQARLDVAPFLERERDMALVAEATLLGLLQE